MRPIETERRAAIILVALLLGVAILAVLGTQGTSWVPGAVAAGRDAQTDEGQRDSRGVGIQTQTLSDTIIIGWDGVQRDHFEDCYEAVLTECAAYDPPLPNVRDLIGDSPIRDVTITDGATDTKAGWVQILSGYNASVTGIYYNADYQPLSEGCSLFEKVEAYLGDEEVDTIFVAGKGTNVGVTCWGETTISGTIETLGEPWCLAERAIAT